MGISDFEQRPYRAAVQNKNLLIILIWLGFLIIFLNFFELPVKKPWLILITT